MSRYIDAEWLLRFFEPFGDDYRTPLGALRACIDDAPTIDIVRCKECRYKRIYDGEIKYCYCALENRRIDEMDYCSWAEREGE